MRIKTSYRALHDNVEVRKMSNERRGGAHTILCKHHPILHT